MVYLLQNVWPCSSLDAAMRGCGMLIDSTIRAETSTEMRGADFILSNQF